MVVYERIEKLMPNFGMPTISQRGLLSVANMQQAQIVSTMIQSLAMRPHGLGCSREHTDSDCGGNYHKLVQTSVRGTSVTIISEATSLKKQAQAC